MHSLFQSIRRQPMLCILILSIFVSTFSKAANSGDTITVGYIVQPPFIVDNAGELSGLSIDLLEKIADQNNYHILYSEYKNADSLISGIQKYKYDLSINPSAPNLDLIDIVDFSHPFMMSNLALAIPSESHQVIMRLLRSIFSWGFLTGVILVGFIMLIFGALTWMFERKKNQLHFPNNLEGLWEAFWWSAVTMTTVGYGDKTPKSTGGRIVAISWMFTALIIISGYTGSVASLLTVNELSLDIQSLNDLRKSKIVVLEYNTAEQFLLLAHIPFKTVGNVKEGLDMVADGRADAFLHDEASIQYELSFETYSDDITIAPAKYSNKFYGFAMPKNHPEFSNINHTMIELTNTLDWKINMGKYRID